MFLFSPSPWDSEAMFMFVVNMFRSAQRIQMCLLSSWMDNEHFLCPGKFYNFLLARVERVCPDVSIGTRWRKKSKQALLEATIDPTIKDERSKEDGQCRPCSLPSSPFFHFSSFTSISINGYKRVYADNQIFLLFDNKVLLPRENGYLFLLEPSRDSLCM